MLNNFRKTAVLKKYDSYAKATKQSIVLKKLGGLPVPTFLQRLALACFRFSIHLSVIFPGTFLETNVYKILKSGSRSSKACNVLIFSHKNP